MNARRVLVGSAISLLGLLSCANAAALGSRPAYVTCLAARRPLMARVISAAERGDATAVARLARENPNASVLIASTAAVANPARADAFAVGVLRSMIQSNPANVSQAAVVACAVADAVQGESDTVAVAVVNAYPAQEGIIVAALTAVLPNSAGRMESAVARATGTTVEQVRALAVADADAGEAAASEGKKIGAHAQTVVKNALE